MCVLYMYVCPVVLVHLYSFLFTGLHREKESFSMCTYTTRVPGIIGESDRSW